MAIHKIVPSEAPQRLRRILLNGAPGMWKTSSLLQLPEPRGIVVSPGEKQFQTIPETEPLAFRVSPENDSHTTCREVERLCLELIAGKHGKLQSFAFDGFHKYLDHIADSVTDGKWFDAEDFEPKIYAMIYRAAEDFLNKICSHNIPWVVVTCWDGDKVDRKARPGEKPSDIPMHIRPGLMGQMAQRIMGEFPVILHAAKRKPDPAMQKRFGYTSDKEVVMWQTQPLGQVHGASIRGPKALVEKIPPFIPADFNVLDKFLAGGEING